MGRFYKEDNIKLAAGPPLVELPKIEALRINPAEILKAAEKLISSGKSKFQYYMGHFTGSTFKPEGAPDSFNPEIDKLTPEQIKNLRNTNFFRSQSKLLKFVLPTVITSASMAALELLPLTKSYVNLTNSLITIMAAVAAKNINFNLVAKAKEIDKFLYEGKIKVLKLDGTGRRVLDPADPSNTIIVVDDINHAPFDLELNNFLAIFNKFKEIKFKYQDGSEIKEYSLNGYYDIDGKSGYLITNETLKSFRDGLPDSIVARYLNAVSKLGIPVAAGIYWFTEYKNINKKIEEKAKTDKKYQEKMKTLGLINDPVTNPQKPEDKIKQQKFIEHARRIRDQAAERGR